MSENERIFYYLSADVSAALFLKMSAELSAAHNFHDERERERERHFLMSDSYSAYNTPYFCGFDHFVAVCKSLREVIICSNITGRQKISNDAH